jgi:flagellar hook-length control protein FliK
LLTREWNHRERPPVFSVTSETAANLSLQNAPSRSTRTDPSAPDSFSALIDSNVAAEPASNDRPVAATAPDRPVQQRPDDPVTDSRQPCGNALSGSATANTPSQAVQSSDTPSVTADGSADPGAAAKPKLGSAKSGIVKTTVEDATSDIIASADTATPSDPGVSPQSAAATAVTPAPVAVAIAVPVAATGVVAPLSNGSATEPLAIAAAAIATSTSTVEASKPAVAAAQAPIDLATNAPATPAPVTAASPIAAPATPATTSPDIADPAAPATNTTQATTPDAVVVPVNQPAPKADTTIQDDPELAATVAVALSVAPVAPKATAKVSSPARGNESAAPIKTGIASDAADPSAASPSSDAADKGVAPKGPAANGKPDGIAVEAAKTDPATTSAPAATATASPHEHRATTAQVQTEASDAGQVANAVQQPHGQSAAPVPAAARLSVTAATLAVVPLNGLALQIAVTAQSGKSRFEIRLDPAELGRIDVRIDVDRHGQLTSHLTVEKPETLAMLRQDAPQLQRALDNAGFKTGDSGLQFSLRDQSSSGQNSGNEAGRHAQRLIISEDDSVPAALAGRTYGRMPGSGSGVDIRV